MIIDVDRYRVRGGDRVDLAQWPTKDDGGLDKAEGKRELERTTERLKALQALMHADNRFALLAVFQAVDAGGKDSTVRRVFGPLNPVGLRVTSFKAPTRDDLAHDYLWRIHGQAPPRGHVGVFNRSHYEDVLVVRVKGLVPEQRWRRRYEHINAFEKLLHDEGTQVLKFLIHISKECQRERLQDRLDRPEKAWQFDTDDLEQRARWEEYQAAYAEALSRCSTEHAPWYVVPGERGWFRDLVVATAVRQRLESLEMRHPEPSFDPSEIKIE